MSTTVRRRVRCRGGRAMSDGRSGEVVPDLLRLGTAAARETTATALRVINEMNTGAREVAGHTKKSRRAASDEGSEPNRGGASHGDVRLSRPGHALERTGHRTAASSEQQKTVEQLIDLFFEVGRSLTETAARLFEVGAGPLESVMSAEAATHDQVRVVLSAKRGQRATGSFRLQNTGEAAVSVTFKQINPLASTKGQISLRSVTFTPVTARIAAGRTRDVKITVSVPRHTTQGTYFGLIRSDDAPGLVVILEVDVT
jgi:hypothetical protein